MRPQVRLVLPGLPQRCHTATMLLRASVSPPVPQLATSPQLGASSPPTLPHSGRSCLCAPDKIQPCCCPSGTFHWGKWCHFSSHIHAVFPSTKIVLGILEKNSHVLSSPCQSIWDQKWSRFWNFLDFEFAQIVNQIVPLMKKKCSVQVFQNLKLLQRPVSTWKVLVLEGDSWSDL